MIGVIVPEKVSTNANMFLLVEHGLEHIVYSIVYKEDKLYCTVLS